MDPQMDQLRDEPQPATRFEITMTASGVVSEAPAEPPPTDETQEQS